ncbi:MAG TPA: nucleotidyltransferase family protein [Candidatus Dormibacteraeota bacterium]|nr:nucleotidyltransferase family protein [Candidatus Dormibacteraeota bacterium]
MTIFLMSDIELPIRGRTYREPQGPHSVVVRGRDIDAGLQHVAARDDCSAIAVVGLPAENRDLTLLAGRKLFLVDSDSARLRDFAEIALRAEADVEWIRSATPPFERLADALLPVGAVVLAAGASTRMPGAQKVLLDFDGRPMVKAVIDAASDGGCHQTVVVYSSDEVKAAIGGDAEVVHNPRADTGMASSLQVGLQALRPEMQAALVMLGDQPMVGSRTVSALLRAWRREGSRPAVAVSRGESGKWTPPVVLSRELWDELLALEGDAGARQVLDRRPELVDIVPAFDSLDDIDTPEDYAKIVRLFPRPNSTPKA